MVKMSALRALLAPFFLSFKSTCICRLTLRATGMIGLVLWP